MNALMILSGLALSGTAHASDDAIEVLGVYPPTTASDVPVTLMGSNLDRFYDLRVFFGDCGTIDGCEADYPEGEVLSVEDDRVEVVVPTGASGDITLIDGAHTTVDPGGYRCEWVQSSSSWWWWGSYTWSCEWSDAVYERQLAHAPSEIMIFEEGPLADALASDLLSDMSREMGLLSFREILENGFTEFEVTVQDSEGQPRDFRITIENLGPEVTAGMDP